MSTIEEIENYDVERMKIKSIFFFGSLCVIELRE